MDLLPIVDAMREYGERWLIGAGPAAPAPGPLKA